MAFDKRPVLHFPILRFQRRYAVKQTFVGDNANRSREI